ncbi:uncharacterized protein LOC8262749 [Ricinus communis]|uniref:Uncharacterized protein n=1 Tax=Ricinus communis TaxID=3988 RepID=B9SLI3_RICCO|nr:uncharacterized protein LOC8262749 [Ricinus communis]EEF35483.1 conserved hypothetical protein [Ricinus communis]|eukprot:XP_002526852.1 uncharacterized protein LOC8262749 [Ricinus communis]
MANSRSGDDRRNGDDVEDSSSFSSGVETSTVRSGNVGLTERLTDILIEDGDGDLLLQRSDREDRVLLWLQALDMQVMGACRADERLKPLLKMNASSGFAEDRLLAHLSQHFEPSEVGMLARCFCIPLVSIRVGKINKQGTLLCPTATRGNLNLTLLPTSDLRLLFIGDDGSTERLFTLSSKAQGPTVKVDEISGDSSGRSFCINVADGRNFYFWCSEKSKLLGIELLAKMKDVLKRRPSIADLTGISKSRLDCFATHLRAYLLGSGTRESAVFFHASSSDTTLDLSNTSSISSKSLRSRYISSQGVKANSSYQGSLSPRSSSFKEGPPRSLSSLRNAAREKLKRRGDGHLSAVDNLMTALPCENDASSSNQTENIKLPEIKSYPVAPSSFLESLGKLAIPPILSSASHETSSSPPLVSPYYCWCPQGVSTMQFSSNSSHLGNSSMESPLLPPLSSLLSATMPSSLLTPTPPLNLADIPKLDFPAFLPDPLVRLPIPTAQQVPTFTPLMCDPIVHIPVIDVCSSGQGYLVSAGPAISGTIPPLHPKFVNPLITETDTMLEKGARETLRLLISSSTQGNPQLLNVLPAVLTNTQDKQGMHAVGSRGLYSGSSDVNAIVNSMATIGLVSLSQSSIGDINAKVLCGGNSLDGLHLDASQDGPSGSFDDDEKNIPFRNSKERTD